MDPVARHLVELIDHFRMENLNQQARCFYCGGFHRTVECESSKREAFHVKLAELAAESRDAEESARDQPLHVGAGFAEEITGGLAGLWSEMA
jgi:hypothetical protein